MKKQLYILLILLNSVSGFGQDLSWVEHDVAGFGNSVYAIDLDGDSDLDILSNYLWYENEGDGNFITTNNIPNAGQSRDIFPADLDGDGNIDILAASYDEIFWLKNDGYGNFVIQPIITNNVISSRCVYSADLDGDGDLDALSASSKDHKIAWYENGGNGIFNTNQNIISTNDDGATGVFAADLDGDNDLDIISSAAGDNAIAWYENEGEGNINTQKKIITTNAGAAWDVYTVDLDNDGDIDVLSASVNDNKIAWYENNGNGNFINNYAITYYASSARSVYATDLDGDNDIDVISASSGNNTIAWYENDGNENFTTYIITTNADFAEDVFAKDLDNDGDVDVIAAASNIIWYENITPITASLLPLNLPTCTGNDDGILQISLNGDEEQLATPYTYTWSLNDGEEIGAGSSEEAIFLIKDLFSGTYDITIVTADLDTAYVHDYYLDFNPELVINNVNTNASLIDEPTGSIEFTIVGGSPPYTVLWTGADSSGIFTNSEEVLLSNLPGGAYNINISDNNNCAIQLGMTLPIIEPCFTPEFPPFAEEPILYVCEGELNEIAFDLIIGLSDAHIAWFATNNPTDTTPIAFGDTIIFENPNIYWAAIATLAEADTCYSERIPLEVKEVILLPNFTVPIYITEGESAELSISIESNIENSTFEVEWTGEGLDDYTIENPTATPAVTTAYTATFTDQNGCTASTSITVFVEPMTTCTVPNSPISLGSVFLCAQVPEPFPMGTSNEIAWFSSNNANDTIPIAFGEEHIFEEGGTYWAAAFTTFEEDTCYSSRTPFVLERAFELTNSGDQTIQQGGSVQISASVVNPESNVTYDFQWDESAQGLSNYFIANPIASPNVTTTYTATFTDDEGCINKTSVTVFVEGTGGGDNCPELAPPIPVQQNLFICEGTMSEVTFEATSEEGTNIIWTDDLNAPLTGLPNGNSYDYFGVGTVYAASYLITADAQFCKSDWTAFTVEEVALTITINGDVTIEEGQSTSLAIIVNHSNPAADYEIQWQGEGLSNYTIANPTATPTDTVNVYTATVTDEYGCVATASVTVFVDFKCPAVNFAPIPIQQDLFVCQGETNMTLFIAGTPNGADGIIWFTDATGSEYIATGESLLWETPNSTVYAATYIDISNGTLPIEICPGGERIPFTLKEATLTLTNSGNTTLQQGQTATLIEVYIGHTDPDVNYTVLWEGEGLADNTAASTLASPTETTTYTAIVTDEYGCTAMTSLTVTVNTESGDCQAALTGDFTNCDGGNYSLIVSDDSQGENIIRYQIDWGDGSNAYDEDNFPLEGLSHTYSNGTFTLTYTITTTEGCTDSVTKTVTNLAEPTFSLTFIENQCELPYEYTPVFSHNGEIESIEWAFPGGSPSSATGENPPTVTYNEAGTYEVILNITDACGSRTLINKFTIFDENEEIEFNNMAACLDASSIDLDSQVSNGDWEGIGVNSSDMFLPSIAGEGVHTLTFTEQQEECLLKGSLEITVYPLPVVSIEGNTNLSHCVENGDFTLPNANPIGGVWTNEQNEVIGGTVSVGDVGIGSFNFTYTYTDPSTDCSGQDQIQVEIYNIEIDLSNIATTYEAVNQNFSFTPILNIPATGTWSSLHNSITPDGNFNPSNVPLNSDTNTGTDVLTYTVSYQGCTASESITITVQEETTSNPNPTTTDNNLQTRNIAHPNVTGPYGVQANTYNGNLYFQRTDLVLPNTNLGIHLSFSYNSFRDSLDIGFGKGFTFSYNMYYYVEDSTDNIVLVRADGRRDLFRKEGGNYVSIAGTFDTWQEHASNQFMLETKYGMRYYFDDSSHKKLTKIQDTNGNTLQLDYDSNGYPNRITDSSNRSVQLNWTNRQLTQVLDENESEVRSITYQYDSEGHLLEVTDPEGYTISYTYNEDVLTTITNERNDILDIYYDETGAVEELASCLSILKMRYNRTDHRTYAIEKNPSGNRMITFVFDEDGKLLSKKGNCCGYNTQYEYDNSFNISKMTDANGNVFTANHDSKGNALLLTDPNGDQQSLAFQPNFNRVKSLTDKKGFQTSFNYDTEGNLIDIFQPESVHLEFRYDTKGNIKELIDGKGNTTTMEYNNKNDLVKITYPDGTSENFVYDEWGNMRKTTDANGNFVEYEYDKLNRLKEIRDGLENKVKLFYDESSNLTSEEDANGNLKEYAYDALHRLESVTTHPSTTESNTTFYGYDPSDNLTSITNAEGNTTLFRYNTRNLLVEETDALGNTLYYSYDGNGNMIAKTDANGDLTSYTYDALNRLTSKTYKGNTDTYTYDANGNLTHCSNNHISMSFTYDSINRLKSKTVNNWNQTIEYEYDENSNRTKMIDKTGTTTYTYDDNNRLTAITNPKGETTRFTYDVGGRLTQQEQANGTITTYEYDVADRLLKLENKDSNGTVISSYEYDYDSNGNRIQMIEKIGNSETTWNYQYDGDNRLTQVKNGTVEENYTFDAVGNRKKLNNTEYNYDEADRIQNTGNTTYQFDSNGNLMEKNENGTITTYEYDGENRLIHVSTSNGETVAFQYDPFGNRISRTSNGELTRYLLDGDNVLMELNANNDMTARYTAGLGLDSWISMERNNASYYYHTDGLGSITALTNENRNVENRYQYDAYGNLIQQTGNTTNPYTYTGREWEETIGLYYYRTRFYDSEVGRFINIDLFGGLLSRPLSLNKYSYVEDNPILYKDPLGLARRGSRRLNLPGGGIFYYFDFTRDDVNIRHDGFVYENGDLSGFSGSGIGPDDEFTADDYDLWSKYYDDDLLREAEDNVRKSGKFLPNSIWTFNDYNLALNNCQDYADAVDKEYDRLYALHPKQSFPPFFGGTNNETNQCFPSENSSSGSQEETPPPSSGSSGGSNPPSSGSGGSSTNIPIIRSFDPNEIIAPKGYGTQRWVAQDATLPYTILFENDPDFATAAAQRVRIDHTFDEDLNEFLFRLGDFGFGSHYFTVPEDVSFYNAELNLKDSLGVLLQVTAGIDFNNRTAFWVLQSKDPETGLASTLPANLGFLPVNDTISRAGEGFVNFTIRPKKSSMTGDTITAQASIVFDDNPAIETNVEFNTIDADAPQTTVEVHETNNGVHELQWSGTDSIGGVMGSGLATYALYASTNEGAFIPIANNLTETSYTHTTSANDDLCFFVIGRDNVSNQEATKLNCEPTCLNVAIASISPASGGANGSITLEVTDNEGDVTYQWSHDETLNSPIALDLEAGEYTVTIMDASGCAVSSVFVIDDVTKIEAIDSESLEGLLIHRMYPVPTDSELLIEFSSHAPTVFLEVYDMAGRKMFAQTIKVENTSNKTSLQQFALNTNSYPSGTYLVRIQSERGSVNGVFVRQ